MFNNQNTIEEKVMDKIKSGRVKLRSKYIFLAERLGMGSAFALSFLLAALFFSLFLFYLKASDNLVYLSFGNRGFLVFLESFPYALVAALIVFIFIAGYLIKKSDWVYKKPFGRLALVLAGLVIIMGAILAYTNMAEMIEREAFGHHPMGILFRSFLQRGLDERQFGITGRVVEVGKNFITIQTPWGAKKIDLKKLESSPRESLKEGSFVMAVGENKGEIFEAREIRAVGERDLPMIRRGVDRRYGPFEPRGLPPPGMENFGDGKAKEPREKSFIPILNFNGGPLSKSCQEKCFIK